MSPLPDGLLERLRAEYREMPGMRLTAAQVQRLCGIERAIWQEVLERLVEAKFLRVSAHGTYACLQEGELSRRRAPGGNGRRFRPLSRDDETSA